MKVIIAEDDPVTNLLITDKLNTWGFEAISVNNGEEVLELVKNNSDVQLYLFDWQMPKLDGISLCKKLKNDVNLKGCYIIILTSRKKTEHLVTALKAGADDFISKPFVPEELKVRLKVGQRLLENENKLFHQAQRDPLTQIYNHITIIESIEKQWHRSNRDGTSLSVVMLDLDFFKKINDTYGHQAGDATLIKFCDTVKSTLRPYDLFGRYGGEEFTLCLPSTDSDQALVVAERIRTKVETTLVEFENDVIRMTVSIGVTLNSENFGSHLELLRAADKALYLAKKQGRNRVALSR